jgi:hypothetical protein
MAYTAGDTILDDEYNAFVNSSSSPYGYNHFAGTGSLEYGLGQSAISTVSVGNTITASQWNSLFTGLSNISNHTNVALTSTAAVSAGDSIAIRAALISDIATMASQIAQGCPNATALSTSSALTTVTTASEGWDNTATQEISVTFTNANQMRWFFNAGGKIRFVVTATASTVSAKDTAFIALGTGVGNLDIGSQATTRSGSGQSLTTNGLANGFYELGTGYTTLIKLTQNSYAAYNANTLEIQAKLDAAPGTATVMTIKMIASDPAADTQYTSGNIGGKAVDVKNTPKMVSTMYSINPTTAEGLSTVYTPASTAQVSNGVT